MKSFLLLQLSFIFLLSSCGMKGNDRQGLQSQIDSLQQKLDHTYKPGLGEFMSGIQVHHAKLWFAGQAENWKLADFEINEIKEALADIRQYNTDRPEIKMLPMIEPALDSVGSSINQKNPTLFKTSFMMLTNTCNACHHATSHEFNVIKIPDSAPFSNQDFKVQ